MLSGRSFGNWPPGLISGPCWLLTSIWVAGKKSFGFVFKSGRNQGRDRGPFKKAKESGSEFRTRGDFFVIFLILRGTMG